MIAGCDAHSFVLAHIVRTVAMRVSIAILLVIISGCYG